MSSRRSYAVVIASQGNTYAELDSVARSALVSVILLQPKGDLPMAQSFPIIDADAHVIETERTWDYLDESDRRYRPRLYSTPNDPTRQYWVLEDKIAGFRFLTLSARELQEFADRAGRNFATPQAARELDDVELRLKHMDELGIDV